MNITDVAMAVAEEPIRLFSRLVTVIGVMEVAPIGTFTVSCVPLAANTVARALPKYTALLAAVAAKPVPVMVTLVPIAPETGEKEVILGAWASALERPATSTKTTGRYE